MKTQTKKETSYKFGRSVSRGKKTAIRKIGGNR